MSSTDGNTRQIIDKDRQFVDFKIDRMDIEQETDRKTGQIINKDRQDAHWTREGQKDRIDSGIIDRKDGHWKRD